MSTAVKSAKVKVMISVCIAYTISIIIRRPLILEDPMLKRSLKTGCENLMLRRSHHRRSQLSRSRAWARRPTTLSSITMRAALRSVARTTQQIAPQSVQSLTTDRSHTNQSHSIQHNLSNAPIGANQISLPTINVPIASQWQQHLDSLFQPVGGEDSKNGYFRWPADFYTKGTVKAIIEHYKVRVDDPEDEEYQNVPFAYFLSRLFENDEKFVAKVCLQISMSPIRDIAN